MCEIRQHYSIMLEEVHITINLVHVLSVTPYNFSSLHSVCHKSQDLNLSIDLLHPSHLTSLLTRV